MTLGLLMRRMALDWILSRRQRVDFGAPVYSKVGAVGMAVRAQGSGFELVSAFACPYFSYFFILHIFSYFISRVALQQR